MATQKQLELREEWAAALESGVYPQASPAFALRDDRAGFSALGVLADLLHRRGIIDCVPYDGISGYWSYDRNEYSLSDRSIQEIGISDYCGSFVSECGLPNSINELSRHSYPFPKIAELIRSAPAGLFVD